MNYDKCKSCTENDITSVYLCLCVCAHASILMFILCCSLSVLHYLTFTTAATALTQSIYIAGYLLKRFRVSILLKATTAVPRLGIQMAAFNFQAQVPIPYATPPPSSILEVKLMPEAQDSKFPVWALCFSWVLMMKCSMPVCLLALVYPDMLSGKRPRRASVLLTDGVSVEVAR